VRGRHYEDGDMLLVLHDESCIERKDDINRSTVMAVWLGREQACAMVVSNNV